MDRLWIGGGDALLGHRPSLVAALRARVVAVVVRWDGMRSLAIAFVSWPHLEASDPSQSESCFFSWKTLDGNWAAFLLAYCTWSRARARVGAGEVRAR